MSKDLLTFDSPKEKAEHKLQNAYYFLDNKELCVEWGEEDGLTGNLFYQDLLDEYNDISREERFLMYLAIEYREDKGIVHSKGERNLERFEIRQRNEKNRIESEANRKETIERNTKIDNKKKQLEKIKKYASIITIIICLCLFIRSIKRLFF